VAQKSNGSIHDCNANLLNLETHSALVPHQCLSYFGNTDYIRNLVKKLRPFTWRYLTMDGAESMTLSSAS